MSTSVGAVAHARRRRARGQQEPLADQQRPAGGAETAHGCSVPEHAEAGAGGASKGRNDRPHRHRAGNGPGPASAKAGIGRAGIGRGPV